MFVLIDDGNVVRHKLCLLSKERNDGLRGIVVNIRFVEAVKQSLLLVAKQRHTQQRRIGLTHKGGNGQADCLGQALHQALCVSSIVIFYVHAVLAIEFPDVKRNAELGHVQLEVLHLKRCALTLVVSK